MIAIGEHYRGPELSKAKIGQLLKCTNLAMKKATGPIVGMDEFAFCNVESSSGPYIQLGSSPLLNVIFYVPGSLGEFEIGRIEASRFSRKQKLLLVAVPVPKQEVESGGSVEFVIDALHEANRIAAETFAKKGTESFNLEKAGALVEMVRKSLVEQGF